MRIGSRVASAAKIPSIETAQIFHATPVRWRQGKMRRALLGHDGDGAGARGSPSAAKSFPSRLIRIVVPSTAGGPTIFWPCHVSQQRLVRVLGAKGFHRCVEMRRGARAGEPGASRSARANKTDTPRSGSTNSNAMAPVALQESSVRPDQGFVAVALRSATTEMPWWSRAPVPQRLARCFVCESQSGKLGRPRRSASVRICALELFEGQGRERLILRALAKARLAIADVVWAEKYSIERGPKW